MTQKSKNIKVSFPAPYPAQIPVIKTCLDSTTKFITLNGSRQTGKSLILSIVACYWALNEPNQNIMIVSPTDAQAKKLFKQIIEMLEPVLFLIKNKKEQAGDAQIKFTNKSVILFRSAASENSLRGYSLTHLLLDEAAFIKEETWSTILAPTLSVRGKKALFCSTPKGKNFFAKLYSKGMNNEIGYKSFKITYHQNPYANLDFIMSQQVTLPQEIFAQEYLGEFTDQTGIFKDVDAVSFLKKQDRPNPNKVYYVGVDIAFKTDYTVAVCVDSDGDMVDYIRFNNVDAHMLNKNLVSFFRKWHPQSIVIEENNQGLPVIDMLRTGEFNINNFQTNPKSKNELINEFMAAVNKKEFKLLNDEVVKDEFKAFSYILTKQGNIQFKAAFGFDDIVMASAFAFKAKKTGQFNSFVML